jgi:hypothetical protein
MATTGNPRPDDEWADGEAEPMEDDLLFADYDLDDELSDRQTEIQYQVSIWRLIEMSREDKRLKRAMVDFEDYDDFEECAEF